jgi:hypothetical protein
MHRSSVSEWLMVMTKANELQLLVLDVVSREQVQLDLSFGILHQIHVLED